jgi:hypothetical protein
MISIYAGHSAATHPLAVTTETAGFYKCLNKSMSAYNRKKENGWLT